MYSDDIAVKVSNLSKCYHIYDKPNDRLKASIYPRLQKLVRRKPGKYFREFWALNDVSFEVRKGETLGIIGSNGSGKSTLLQIICGTLNPTDGKIQTKGRVAALLELGSGFNPDFTGRENVYMNAALWGLRKDQIDERFDDIVSFADIGAFIEQPVKTYSSGMFVRLAFAVIAHVDADILVIDEALAVGDAVFTQKCMRFIRGFQEQGTLLFVSHDISAVQNLCKAGIWLKDGRIERYGKAKSICEAYIQFTNQQIYGDEVQLTALASGSAKEDGRLQDAPVDGEEPRAIDYGAVASVRNNIKSANGWKTGRADVVSVSLSSITPGKEGIFEGGERVRMTVRAKANGALKNPILGFLVRDRLGQNLFGENTLSFTKRVPTSIEAGRMFEGVFEFRLPMLPNGQYVVMASVADGDLFNNIQHYWLHDALIINVSSSKVRYGLMGIPFERIEMEVIDDR